MTLKVLNPITLILSAICIQWVALASAGPFSVKIPYVMLSLGILYAVTSPSRLLSCVQFIRHNAMWIAPFAIYLLLLTLVFLGENRQNMPLRQIFFLLGSIALAGSLAVVPNLSSVVRTGAALALGLLMIAVELFAWTIGLSWTDAIVEFFVKGDRQFVTYKFLRGVFNAMDPDSDTLISASRKNGIAVTVLVAALLFRGGYIRASRDLTGMAVFSAALLLLFLLNTRSVLIVAGLGILLTTVIGAVVRPALLSEHVVKAVAALVIVGLAFTLTDAESPTIGTISDRLAFEDQSTASRVGQYQAALDQIEKHPLTGSGYFEVHGQPIHNLFLSAWVHAGLAAFMLVVVFYFALIARWLTILFTYTRAPAHWVVPIAFEWIAPLPMLPLFRVWLAGDGGHMFLGEWVALATFLGIVLANDFALRRQLQRPRSIVSPPGLGPATARFAP